MNYCNTIKRNEEGFYIDYENNLVIDDRIHDAKKQKTNGLQIFLYDLERDLGKPSEEILKDYDKYKTIHLDVVMANLPFGNGFGLITKMFLIMI